MDIFWIPYFTAYEVLAAVASYFLNKKLIKDKLDEAQNHLIGGIQPTLHSD